MAVAHVTTVRNGMADYVVDLIDAGGAGTLEFQTSGDVMVATVTFSATAFGNAGAVTEGLATAAAITEDSSAVGGTVAKFRIFSGTPSEILEGTVSLTGNGGDIIMSSLTVAATDRVSLDSLTYEAAA